MVAFLLRSLGLLIFAAAFIALIADGVKSLAADAVVTTSLGETWASLSPQSLAAAEAMVERRAGPHLWDPVITTALTWPSFALGGAVGLVLMIAGSRRRRRPRPVA